MAAGKGSAEISGVFDGLIAYVEFHHALGERMMMIADYACAEAHTAEHMNFTDHIY